MYRALSLVLGMVISIVILMNGGLAARYGLYSSVVIIHVMSFIVIGCILLIRRERVFAKRISPILYLGGVAGILTILLANYSIQHLSVSAILAFGLLGQCVMGLIVDQFGLFGMPHHVITKSKLMGLGIIFLGSIAIIQGFEAWAAILAIASGMLIVLSRTINMRLTEETNLYLSTFYNFLFGLLTAILLFLFQGSAEYDLPVFGVDAFSEQWYIYLGGILGVAVILGSSMVVNKISSIQMTVLLFVGQVLSGLAIDFMVLSEFSLQILIGVGIVSIGLGLYIIFEKSSHMTNKIKSSSKSI